MAFRKSKFALKRGPDIGIHWMELRWSRSKSSQTYLDKLACAASIVPIGYNLNDDT
jgi:hypothetical protein